MSNSAIPGTIETSPPAAGAAIGGFAGGLIFWEMIKPLVGLA